MSAGTTPARNVRVADETWEAAKAKAAGEGTTVAAVINAALEAYVAGPSPVEVLAAGTGRVEVAGVRLEFLGDGAVRVASDFEGITLVAPQVAVLSRLAGGAS